MGYKIITKLGMECMGLNVIYVMHNMLGNTYEIKKHWRHVGNLV
jgi:hypothetical protein